MSKLQVYRASAGSGKTYKLTQEYIMLLFDEPLNYRHTLAVTFTNKATAEMRTRILNSLSDLANREIKNPEHLKELQSRFALSENEVRQKAETLLGQLLHDYSKFSISTIDSFFQKVTRSFAHEMGLPIGFRLELEAKHIMLQAIDQLILEMDKPEHRETKNWLIEFAGDKMERDNSWNISGEIEKISTQIFNETYQASATLLSRQLKDKRYLSTYKNALWEICDNVDKQISEIGMQGLTLISHYKLDISEDFSGKSRSKVKVFERMANLENHLELEKFAKLLDGVDEWTRKDNKPEKNMAITEAYYSGLHALLVKAAEIIEQKSKDYHTAKSILKQLNALGLIQDVYENMMKISREQNVFMISGTNYLLARIIDDNDTPFIYEKTGTRYSNFMIDEFQDTSALQYKNFIPLVRDSLASGKHSLIVGDVKQAIYRWRNSDWNLLADAVERDYSTYGVDIETLDTNWRSSPDIIKFNNSFFTLAAGTLQRQFNRLIPDDISNQPHIMAMQSKISKAYFDVVQKHSPKKSELGGDVYIKVIEASKKEDFMEEAIGTAISRIEELLRSGFEPSEISVLVRNNKEGVEITNAMLSGAYHSKKEALDVISNESLILSKSEAVKLIIEQLKFVRNPDDQLSASFVRLHIMKQQPLNKDLSSEESAGQLDASLSLSSYDSETAWKNYLSKLGLLREKPFYELVESLIELLPNQIKKSNSVYLQSFLSLCLDYINRESADLNQFLEHWDKRASGTSLSVADSHNAIRVMTIHKSKGLEFKAVVLPFASWEINSLSHTDLLWLSPKVEPFNAVALVPVAGSSVLAKTHFAEDYLDEVLHQYVDNLNLSYVALTRAKESINIIARVSNLEKTSEIKEIGDLIYNYAKSAGDGWDAASMSYKVENRKHESPTSGIISKQEGEKHFNGKREKLTRESHDFVQIPLGKRALIHLESENYFNSDAGEAINKGNIMHALFERISTASDIEKAMSSLRFEGKIEGSELSYYRELLQELLGHPSVSKWFDGSYQVKTEAAILSTRERRPDRVMINNSEVLVVDYKFGHQKHPNHISQVRQYIQLIKKMGYEKVKGYIWYAGKGDIVEVDVTN